MTAQKRGAVLEDSVESILKELQVEMKLTYYRGGNFVSASGKQAKADFTVPLRERPKIIIEAKGYEATGSKLTDVLGDILKVLGTKDEDAHYFFVTDGIGWYRRLSDLKKNRRVPPARGHRNDLHNQHSSRAERSYSKDNEHLTSVVSTI